MYYLLCRPGHTIASVAQYYRIESSLFHAFLGAHSWQCSVSNTKVQGENAVPAEVLPSVDYRHEQRESDSQRRHQSWCGRRLRSLRGEGPLPELIDAGKGESDSFVYHLVIDTINRFSENRFL